MNLSLVPEPQNLPAAQMWQDEYLSGLATGDIPILTWDQFRTLMDWQQGEHVGIIGPTGQGKSTLALALLHDRDYVCMFATKPRDSTLDRFAAEYDYRVLKQWNGRMRTDPGRFTRGYPRRVLWPLAQDLHSATHQRSVFESALSSIYREGGWTVYFDELWIMCRTLRLDHEFKTYLMQSRSNEISVVASSQRPAWIPVEVYDQSTHLLFCRDNDRTNLERISGVGYLDSRRIREIVPRLERYQFLYINTRNGAMCRTTAPLSVEGG